MSSESKDLPESAAAAAEAPPARKRTRAAPRARKPEALAPDAVVSSSEPTDLAVVAAPAEAAVPDIPVVVEKPKRAPRKPRAKVATVVDAAEGVSIADGAIPAVPAAEVVNAPVVDAAPLDASAIESVSVAVVGEALAAVETPVVESGDATAADGAGDRGRGRRRGRRGSAGSDAVAATESVTHEVAGQGVLSVAPEAPDVQAVFASVLAGEFDADSDQDAVVGDAPEKRVLLPDADAPKLHKVLAQSGIGSRRDMEQFIGDGRVAVNGETAHTGMRISFGDKVTIDGKPVRVRIAPPPPRVIAYHKPAGEVVSHDDPQQRPTVFRNLPRLSQGKWQSVGRLDLNTEGLLLFTTSGDLANKLMHPRFGVEREYAVRVLGTLEKEPKARLLAGVDIEGQSAAFKSIEDGGGEGVNHWYRVVITEGRNREVRKLFDAVGLTVSRLMRIRYGCVVMPRGLKRGVCVDLSENDVKALRQLTGAQSPQGQPRRDGEGRGGKRRDGRDGDREAPPAARDGARDTGREGAGRDRKPGGRSGPAPERRTGGRPERLERSDRPAQEAKPRGDRRGTDRAPGEFREPGDPARIPNPLQQTYDRRAVQNERRVRDDDDFENGPIPNPLQQTYDRRFVQGNPRGGAKGGKAGKGGGAPRQPDPMQTSVGYIGADAFTRKLQGRGGGGGRRGGR